MAIRGTDWVLMKSEISSISGKGVVGEWRLRKVLMVRTTG